MASSTATAPVAAMKETSKMEAAAATGTEDEKSAALATALEDEDCKDDEVLNSSLRSCANDPDFAVICAFLQKFANDLDLNFPNFKQMQEWLTNTDEVADQLRDMHIKLLRKIRKSVQEKNWETALSKFCFSYSAQDGWEVERFGYKKSSLKVKLHILRELLESQFERNLKFRNKIFTLDADLLRSQPIGRDRLGHTYWLTQDVDSNLRIYQEHLDEEIWQVVATNRDEFVNLIARLRGNEVVLPSTDIGVIDEDTSSSNSCAAPIEKPPPPEEQDDSQEEETKVPNLRIKLGSNSLATVSTPVSVGKGEEELAAEEDAKLQKKKMAAVTKLSSKTDIKEHEDGDDEEEEEEEEEGEEEYDEEDESDAEDDDEDEIERAKDATKNVSNKTEKTKIAVPEVQKKPLLISHAKIAASSPTQQIMSTNNAGTKKRALDEVDKSSSGLEDSSTIKKLRPTLLDSKREKKPSRYEKVNSEDDEADEEDEEEEEGEEEEDDDIEEGEEEDIDSAAAEEDENEEKDIEDDDDDDEVGEAIEDPPIIVQGEGAGKMCDGANPTEIINFFEENTFLLIIDDENFESDEPEISEAIEEELLYISGEGCGSECLVGNGKNEEPTITPTTITAPTTPTTSEPMNEPKATFFFGEPGCLKLSPIKKTPSKEEDDKTDEEIDGTFQDKIGELNVVERRSPEEKNNENSVEKKTAVGNTEQTRNDKKHDASVSKCNNMPEVTDDKKPLEEGAEVLHDSKSSSKASQEINETIEDHATNGSTKISGDIKTNGKDELESNKDTTMDDSETNDKNVKQTNKTELLDQKDVGYNNESTENIKNDKETTNELDKNILAKVPENLETTSDVRDKSKERPTNLEPVKEVENKTHEALKETNDKPLKNLPITLNLSSKPSLEVTPASSSNTKCSTMNLHNRKRRLTDLTAVEKTATRHSTSESELDLSYENQEEATAAGAIEDEVEDVEDVGGKRLKMRPKLTNSEIRKKVEAQKIAIEETTSSSSEEDARRKRKIISPKRQSTEKPSNQEVQKNTKESEEVQKAYSMKIASSDHIRESAAVVSPSAATSQSTVDSKITLVEIIEKKLKKNPEKPISECAAAISTSSVVVATAVLTPTKKKPITKPLKKNLLTQLSQEKSDEESIPRKRTICETFCQTAEKEQTPDPLDISEMNKDEIEAYNKPERKTPERQRKRRSNAEVKQNEMTGNNVTEYVVEKLKKSEPDDIKKIDDPLNLPKVLEEKLTPTLKHLEKIEEKLVITALPKHLKTIEKTEKDEIKPEVQRETSPPAAAGRRSSRRGGAAVIYTELPEPKRTRNIKSATTMVTPKIKKELAKTKELVQSQPTLKTPEIKKLTALVKKETKQPNKIDNTKSEAATESKLIVKSNVKEEKFSVVQAVTPTSVSTIRTSTTPMTTPKSSGRKMREIDTVNILENVDSETPVRQSRRIAQQKIKEEAERRKLEEIALRTMKNELKKKKKAEAKADPTVAEISDHLTSSSSEESEEETKKSKKKKCPGKDGTWSSGSEEQEEPEEEEEDPTRLDTDPGSPLFKSDHEFSPESELEDESQAVPMKRARTARKEDAESDTEEEEEACQKCGKSVHPEWILLCDSCDKGYHCSCLSPVLFYIPEGEWHCPPCQQAQLIAALEKKLQEFDDVVERRKLKELENKRLAQEAELATKERLLEEKLNKKKKKEDGGTDDSSENEDESDGDSKRSGKKRKDDDDKEKSVRKDKKSKKNADEKSKRRRDGDGSSRRRRRRAATRGARRRRRNESHSGSSAGSVGSGSGSKSGSESSSSDSSSSSATDSDDEPIYKLRKRRQINVSYRLNEYDDLINSALKKEMGEAAVIGSLGRGKDISTIIEADKDHEGRQKQLAATGETADEDEIKLKEEGKTNAGGASKATTEEKPDIVGQGKTDSEEEPLKSNARLKPNLKKKARKLTTLDISSEDDNASDEDFKTGSFDDDEEEDTSISASNSDSSLEVYRRRNKGSKKKTRKAARRAARERRKHRKFLVDDSEEEEEARPKSKKKRKDDSDYTETEDELSELSENVDSADLCDDSTSSGNSDGAWRPSKRKKQRKSSAKIARKSPKLKKPILKKPKRIEYSDDDISEDEEEDYDDEDDIGGGKGSGKQPRSVPLKSSSGKGKGKGKGGAGAGKSSKTAVGKKKKKNMSDYDDESLSDSEDSTRRTRGRRYAYLDDFEDDSSDGGIKPGVHRPDTPPEEREKFIKKQEEIKRMLAEKNAEGAKLAATPRLTPIKGAGEKSTRSPAKPGDSLSTVPLSVIRQAKVLDIDYLQRKGESVSDVDNVDDVDSEFDDADLPDDFPEDMDEDAIARMVEEEEELVSAAASRELPPSDEVVKTMPAKPKARENERPTVALGTNPSLAALSQIPTTSVGPTTSASGLQEPMRKRLPMPTMHPPLLRHQYPGGHPGIPPHMMHRHPGLPTHLLQNALSAPLGQAMHRNFPQHAGMGGQRIPPSGMPPRHGMPLRYATPPRHALPPHLLPPTQQQLASSQQLLPSTSTASAAGVPATAGIDTAEPKPRGRRKKITPLRDPLQKQQAAAAATAAAAVQAGSTTCGEKGEMIPKAEVNTGVIKTAPTSLGIAQPPQLYKPPSGSNSGGASVITRMPHLPPHGAPLRSRGMPPGPPGMYAGGDVNRFYGPPGPQGARQPLGSAAQRHRGGPQISGMPAHHGMRPSYGPPPLRGVPATGSQPPPGTVSNTRSPYPPTSHGEHHVQPPTGPYGPPPPARHATPHMNQYRPSTYGNPNYPPRGAPPRQHLRTAGPLGPEYHAGPRPYAPYGYYPPPPPLTAAHPSSTAHPTSTVHPPSNIHPPPRSLHPASTVPPSTQPPQVHPHPPHAIAAAPPATHAAVPSSVIVTAPPSNSSVISVTRPPPPSSSTTGVSVLVAVESHKTRVITDAKSASTISPPPSAELLVKNEKSCAVAALAAETTKSLSPVAAPSIVVAEPRSKKLITLETYATTKSPLAIGGESSGSRSSPNVQPDAANDSSSTPAATSPGGGGGTENDRQGASEFSGLVSYFSSQHDDYNT